MRKRTLQQLQTGWSYLLVGILLTIVWLSQNAWASPPLKPLQDGPPPEMISYQGLVNVDGLPYDGTGLFKFAIVDGSGATTYWSNDGTSVSGGEPSSAVSLLVENGLFNVLLGDTSLPNMTSPLEDDVFAETETFLRIWFNDGVSGFEQLVPDTRIASVAYALRATYAENGPTGPQGPTGPTGDPGPTGPQGPAGTSFPASVVTEFAQAAEGTVDNISFAGGRTVTGTCAPNGTLQLDFDWNLVPHATNIQQVNVGFVGGDTRCVASGVGALAGSSSLSLTCPATPGSYQLGMSRTWCYGCPPGCNLGDPHDPPGDNTPGYGVSADGLSFIGAVTVK